MLPRTYGGTKIAATLFDHACFVALENGRHQFIRYAEGIEELLRSRTYTPEGVLVQTSERKTSLTTIIQYYFGVLGAQDFLHAARTAKSQSAEENAIRRRLGSLASFAMEIMTLLEGDDQGVFLQRLWNIDAAIKREFFRHFLGFTLEFEKNEFDARISGTHKDSTKLILARFTILILAAFPELTTSAKSDATVLLNAIDLWNRSVFYDVFLAKHAREGTLVRVFVEAMTPS